MKSHLNFQRKTRDSKEKEEGTVEVEPRYPKEEIIDKNKVIELIIKPNGLPKATEEKNFDDKCFKPRK